MRFSGLHLSRSQTVRRVVAATLAVLLATSLAGLSRGADASVLPSGFQDTVVLSGMTNPTVVQFAPDGRIFVGQKNGVIKVFSSLTDTSPVTFADLSAEVDDYWDRGLLGLALDPDFPTRPTSTCCTPTTRPSAGSRHAGTTRAPAPRERPPTVAWSPLASPS